MANSKTSLTDVGAASGQLKSKFSLLERTQIDALGGTSGSLSSGAGLINGSVSSSLTGATNNTRSKLEYGFNIAEQLESSGITIKNTSSFISTSVSRAVTNKTALNQNLSISPINAANPNNNPTISSRKQRPQQIMKEKLESIVGRDDLNYGGLQFPLDLMEVASSYMQLQFSTYNRESPQVAGTITPGPSSIYLPFPENLSQAFGISYSQRDTGYATAILESSLGEKVSKSLTQLSGNKNNSEDIGAILNNMSQNLSGVTVKDLGSDLAKIGFRAGNFLLSSVEEDIGGLTQQALGQIPNPHPTVFFKGLQLRSFPLNWRLVPKSSNEASTLKKILDEIKRNCLPKKNAALDSLRYPNFVEIIPRGAAADKIGKYKRTLVSSITINYTPEGTSAWFHDGYPVAVQLAMEFQEVENFTSEDV
jgi:hypothetical protein